MDAKHRNTEIQCELYHDQRIHVFSLQKDIWPAMPTLIFAVLAFLSGGLTFILPETLNKKLPESMEEAEQFGLK